MVTGRKNYHPSRQIRYRHPYGFVNSRVSRFFLLFFALFVFSGLFFVFFVLFFAFPVSFFAFFVLFFVFFASPRASRDTVLERDI